jgi:short-subunit dehydrogenase
VKKAKTVLITGATGGIGRATALALAREGHRVFATGRREAALKDLDWEARGLRLETIFLDVSSRRSIAGARYAVDQKTDGEGVDVLINNAGYGVAAPMEFITDDEMRGQFETNVFGLVAVSQAFLPAMRRRGRGRIVNVSSMVGRMTLPLQGIYCATKHAVESISDAMRRELAGSGIEVVCVEPGAIRTGFEATAVGPAARYMEEGGPYASAMRTYTRTVARTYKSAPGPEPVVRTLSHVVNCRRPRPRYVSPWHNSLLIWVTNLLPTRLADFIFRRAMGL